MARKILTVGKLAEEAGVELDEALVTLWDLGIDEAINSDDVIRGAQVTRARRALGVATIRQLRTIDYWELLLGLDKASLDQLLGQWGITLSVEATRLPSGAVSKLKAEARRRGIDPLTGTIALQEEGDATRSSRRGEEPRNAPRIAESVEWRWPGHRRPLRFLTRDEVLGIHHQVVRDFADAPDPVGMGGIRSEDLLGSAVFRPQTSLGGELKYPTAELSAAALLHAIILDHPFHNGNKRTALVSMLVALDENGIFPQFDQDEVFKLVVRVAQHTLVKLRTNNLSDAEVLAVADWICERSRLVEKGEQPIPWRRMKRILAAYGCDFELPGGVGNRINIRRVERRKGILGKVKQLQLSTQVYYADDGRDVEIDTVKKIRRDLQLDDLHGVDSLSFYDKDPTRAEDFIARYRKTLRRLAAL